MKAGPQSWAVGEAVQTGFLTLTVRAILPADGGPTRYLLSNAAGTKLYRFSPYTGVRTVTVEEAREMLASSKEQLERKAQREAAKAYAEVQAAAAINNLLATA